MEVSTMNHQKNLLQSFLSSLGSRAAGEKKQHQEKEFFFNEFYVAGYPYYQAEEIEETLLEGKQVYFVREPGCQHDSRAVEVYANGKKLGYIPRRDNNNIAQLMDKGITINGEICKRNFDDIPCRRVKISAYRYKENN